MSKNKSTAKHLRDVWHKSGGVCAHCGRRPTSPKSKTVDHYIPQAFGGTNDQRNLMPLCRTCNQNRDIRMISPKEFYQYAAEEYVQECLAYEEEFNKSRTSTDGTMWY